MISIRSLVCNGLVLSGLCTSAYALREGLDPHSLLMIGLASFFLGVLGAARR